MWLNPNKAFKIMALNVNSLVGHSKRISLNNFLKKHNPHALCMSETGLLERHRLSFDGYNFIRTDKTTDSRGTGILIGSSCRALRVEVMDLRRMEVTAVKILLNQNENIVIVGLYVPNIIRYQDMEHDLCTLSAFAGSFSNAIICGDFNARHVMWNDTAASRSGRWIADWLNGNQHLHNFVVISQHFPTFPRSGSIIDFFLVTSSLLNQLPGQANFICSACTGISDHAAVGLEIDLGSNINFQRVEEPRYRSFARTNWREFSRFLAQNLENVPLSRGRNLDGLEIDCLIEKFNENVTLAVERHSCTLPFKNYKYRDLPLPLLNMYKLRQAWKKLLGRIRRRYGNSNNPEYRSLLSQIRCLSTLIDRQTSQFLESQLSRKLRSIKCDGNAFREINRLVGKHIFTPEKLVVGGVTITDPSEIPDAFADSYESQFRENTILREHRAHVEETVDSYLDPLRDRCGNYVPMTCFSEENPSDAPTTSSSSIFIDTSFTENLIRTGNGKKSLGPDGISNFILKKLPMVAFAFLTVIINNCLNIGYFPSGWKVARIFPVPKVSRPTGTSDFRPISLISVLAKKLETILKNGIVAYCETAGLIPDLQFGFRAGHSTTHAILRFHNDVRLDLNRGDVVAACFLDVAKAFDRVWINGLIYKMIIFGFPPELIKISYSFLIGRKFYVELGTNASSRRHCLAGVPQGSVLGPLLFIIYTADLPVRNEYAKTLLYADDSVTYASDFNPGWAVTKLKEGLVSLVRYYDKWGIGVNTAKSKFMLFRRPTTGSRIVTLCGKTELILNGENIQKCCNVKYLGIWFNQKLKFRYHADRALEKMNVAYGLVAPLMRVRLGLSTRVKMLLYGQLIRPVVSYAFPVWFTINQTSMRKLLAKEIKILRSCTAKFFESRFRYFPNRDVYEEASRYAKFAPLDQFLISLGENFLRRIEEHQNPQISTLATDNRDTDAANEYPSQMKIIRNPELFTKDARGRVKYYVNAFYDNNLRG